MALILSDLREYIDKDPKTCRRCGYYGAKYAPLGDSSNGLFCYNCIDAATYRLQQIRRENSNRN